MNPVNRLLVAKGVRAFGDGYVSLLLPVYLLERGFRPWQVGVIATATLLGSGLLTLLVGLQSHRFPTRTLLLAATALMAGTGVGFAAVGDFWPLLLIAFVGTLNPSSGDVSVFLPLEHAALARFADDRRRTAVFARYSLVGALAAASGALASALPEWLASVAVLTLVEALQAMFLLYAACAVVAAGLYRRFPRTAASGSGPRSAPLTTARKNVVRLAALFSLDAFAGGFVVQSMLALWLFQTFSMSLADAATLFFWTGLLTAFSYLVAARVAERWGLVNTMVFTHLPSSLCLVAIPFASSLSVVVALLVVRSALSQMDVPTRSSYVMAIVPPAERAAAASLTSVPRSLASALSPSMAGVLLGASPFGWPLLVAGALKIVYDLLLLGQFRAVRPPEEQEGRSTAPSDEARSR